MDGMPRQVKTQYVVGLLMVGLVVLSRVHWEARASRPGLFWMIGTTTDHIQIQGAPVLGQEVGSAVVMEAANAAAGHEQDLRSEAGRWMHDQAFCEFSPYSRLFCSPNNMSFYHGRLLSVEEHCSRLRGAGISKIKIIGDSLMRHLYLASFLILSRGDESWAKKCRTEWVDPKHVFRAGESSACNGQVKLTFTSGKNPRPKFPEAYNDGVEYNNQSRTITVFGVGLHPINGHYDTFQEMYNIDFWRSHSFDNLCAAPRWARHSTIWVPPHRGQTLVERLRSQMKKRWRFQQQWPLDEKSQQYNINSSRIMSGCGIRVLDTLNLTLSLGNPDSEIVFGIVAPDVQHYGLEINMIKAEGLLRLAGSPWLDLRG